MAKLDFVITVDPGDQTGWAFWRRDLKRPITGSFKNAFTKFSWYRQFQDMSTQFDYVLKSKNILSCIIEGVEVWSSLKSQTAARRGNLTKLSYLIGTYFKCCIDRGIPCDIISPQSWKGQMNDIVVRRRVKRALNIEYDSVHVCCAVGIGLSIMKKL